MKINGEMHYLLRAVDHEGEVLESFASKSRDKAAASTMFTDYRGRRGGRPVLTCESSASVSVVWIAAR